MVSAFVSGFIPIAYSFWTDWRTKGILYHMCCKARNLQYLCPVISGESMGKKMMSVLVTAVALLFCAGASAQDNGYDVFNPIAKYISTGEAEKLSAWFSDNLEVTIFSNSNESSRNQAKQIMKSFFKSYTPRSFDINHKAGRANMKYALGTLNAGGELFTVTIFVNYNESEYKIQHLKIERMD